MTLTHPEAEAAVAIVDARGPQECVLLMRRSQRESDPWSGHWSFPGGRREPSDAGLLETALRELFEECGLRLGREHLQRALEPVAARRRVGRSLWVAPFVFEVPMALEAVPDMREAVEAAWLPLRVLRDPARHRLRSVPGMPEGMLFPAVELGAVPLWGFTYRLITEWLGLAPGRGEAEAMAREVLGVLARGGQVVVERDWESREALVRGAIPVADVLARLGAGGRGIPGVNAVEVRAEGVRIVGLGFEEYRIRAI